MSLLVCGCVFFDTIGNMFCLKAILTYHVVISNTVHIYKNIFLHVKFLYIVFSLTSCCGHLADGRWSISYLDCGDYVGSEENKKTDIFKSGLWRRKKIHPIVYLMSITNNKSFLKQNTFDTNMCHPFYMQLKYI